MASRAASNLVNKINNICNVIRNYIGMSAMRAHARAQRVSAALALPWRPASVSADFSSGRTFARSRIFCLPRIGFGVVQRTDEGSTKGHCSWQVSIVVRCGASHRRRAAGGFTGVDSNGINIQ